MNNSPNPINLGSSWWEYTSGLYVDRGPVQHELLSWLDEPAPRHVIRFLGGPPGTGKSWLLSHLRDEIQNRNNHQEVPRFLVQLNAVDMLDRFCHARIKRDIAERANICCPGLDYPLDSMLTLPAFIEDVRQRLCGLCPSSSPVLLVDGCDELISRDDFDELQRRYLTPFFRTNHDCFRMIIVQRNELTELNLRKRSLPTSLGVFDEPNDASIDQIGRLLSHFAVDTPVPQDIQDLRALLPDYCEYQWNHPLINGFLLEKKLTQGHLSSQALTDCCMFLVNRPGLSTDNPGRHPPLSIQECELLVQWALILPVRWPQEDFRQLTGKSLDIAHIQRGIITRDSSQSPYYRIADGLRELLRDLATMRQQGV